MIHPGFLLPTARLARRAWLGVLLSALLLPAAAQAEAPIDRRAVVQRHDPRVRSFDTLSSLTVGNGGFAFTVDPTGLQTFAAEYSRGVPLCTMSSWGWHSFPNTDSLRPEESRRVLHLHGRPSQYAVECKDEGRGRAATEYFRMNPHRLNLANISLRLHGGRALVAADTAAFSDIDQHLDLWRGIIESSYTLLGAPVRVHTGVLPESDCVFARIVSPLVAEGTVSVAMEMPLPTGVHSDNADALHSAAPVPPRALAVADSMAVVCITPNSAVLRRSLDDTVYYMLLRWERGTVADIDTAGCRVRLRACHTDTLSFAVDFLPDLSAMPLDAPYSFDNARAAVSQWWQQWWQTGGFADFGECTDPRAPELERRVVLSQYLTQVNCAGPMPPQETGLTYNSWFGRPHLEMTWWHGVDFCLWGRPHVLESWMRWYGAGAFSEARALAERQGFDGVRWLKMTDPWSGEAPSNVGSFLIWQQPHYIYFAEELYRAAPTQQTLERYAPAVLATADFMADYAEACSGGDGTPIELRGHTAMQESMSKDFSYAHPFEQAYWKYGLLTANRWRERMGLDPDPRWQRLALAMAPLAEEGGIYTSGRQLPGVSNPDFSLKSRSDHPAVLGACGLLPDCGLYDSGTMEHTLCQVIDNWNWPTTWGWDYGMTAMAAARLGCPDLAVDALLVPMQKNTYLASGHNYQEPARLRIYLPGNGALLTAVAMMCAGWDGATAPNPGFPADGTWCVRWEGLRPMQ